MKDMEQNTSAPEPLRWRIRRWLHRELFTAEYQSISYLTRERDEWRALAERMKKEWDPQPARFELEGGMPEEEIAQRLAGQERTPLMLAVMAHLGAQVVILADQATDVPHAALDHDTRLHFCGQAAGVAGVLADLQRLTAPQEEEGKPAA